jgi:hypothetical protein
VLGGYLIFVNNNHQILVSWKIQNQTTFGSGHLKKPHQELVGCLKLRKGPAVFRLVIWLFRKIENDSLDHNSPLFWYNRGYTHSRGMCLQEPWLPAQDTNHPDTRESF